MQQLLWTVLSLSLSGGILALLLLALRPLYQGRLPAAWRYYVWLIVLVRLVLPFGLPQVNLVGALFTQGQEAVRAQPVQQAAGMPDMANLPADESLAEPVMGDTPEMETPTASNLAKWLTTAVEYAWVVWLGVALLLLVRKGTSYGSFIRYIRAGWAPVDDASVLDTYFEACEALRIRKPPELCINPLAASPMMLGLVHPTIVLPHHDMDPDALRMVLEHELIHYRRRDILYKWFSQIVLCIHWFNPLVYLAVREINKACELSCDEQVLRSKDETQRRAYGSTLMDVLKGDGRYRDPIASITMSEEGKLMKERLKSILSAPGRSTAMRLMALSLTLVLLAGATVAGAYTATTGTVPAQDPTMENPEPTDGIVDGGDGQDPWTMDMTQLHYAQDYIIGIKIVAQHKSGGAAGLPAVQYTAETAEHRTSEPFQAALTEALGDFWANYDASQWQILSATVTEVAGPFTEPTAALLTQFYEEDNLRYLSAVADKAEDADMTGLIERAFDERKDSYFSVLIGSLKSPQDFSELAMRAYEQQRVAALTIVAEYTKAETLREIVYRAFDERRTAELAVLMDEVSIYYEEIADRMLANPSGATSVLSVVAENIPTEKADEIGKLLYERNDISSFTIIMDIMSAEAREQVLEKATADKNVTFQSVLAW